MNGPGLPRRSLLRVSARTRYPRCLNARTANFPRYPVEPATSTVIVIEEFLRGEFYHRVLGRIGHTNGNVYTNGHRWKLPRQNAVKPTRPKAKRAPGHGPAKGAAEPRSDPEPLWGLPETPHARAYSKEPA